MSGEATPYVLAGAGSVLTVIGFFLTRLLSQIDANAKAQWRKIDDLREKVDGHNTRLVRVETLLDAAEKAET